MEVPMIQLTTGEAEVLKEFKVGWHRDKHRPCKFIN